ncbi:MAG: hypothetical protein IAF02_27435, partial [Anaerolineae bacterium]|nr:hypothetical protein [Anaerolineae bacterium]
IDYGVHLVDEAQFVPQVIRQMQAEALQTPVLPSVRISDNGRSPILTESDLFSYRPGTTVHLPAHTRLTPLAQDSAQKRNLTLVFEK